jgi:hypothetical protein
MVDNFTIESLIFPIKRVKDKNMPLHSEFLVHWTGKDFHGNRLCSLPIKANLRLQYIYRLRDTFEKGLFMKRGTETIHGFKSQLTSSITRACFTEIRLSSAINHASRYGLLGIGFNRSFVIKRGGNPVFYVQNGQQGTIAYNLAIIGSEIKKDQELLKVFELILGYFKNMSEPNNADLIYYNEMEWRIVEFEQLIGKFMTVENAQQHIYRLKMNPSDVRLIVFPDSETIQMAMDDSIIANWIKKGNPNITTVSDCKHF